MDGPTGSISVEIFGKRVDPGGMRAPAGARITYTILAVAAMVAHLPTRADADTVHGALDRAAVGVSIQPARLEPGVLRATGPVMRLPDAIPGFGETEPTVPAREPKVAIYRADTPRNFEINLHLNPASDEAECDVALRVLSPSDYYVVRIDGRGERVAFSRVSQGRAREIASVDRRVAANSWHSLRVEAENNQFTVTLDGERIFTAYDTAFPNSGRVAVWTIAGRPVQFDVIAVTGLTAE